MEQQGNQESQQTEHSGFVDNNEQYIIPVCLLYLLEYTGILAFSTTGGAQLVDNLILLSNKGTHFLLDIFIHISMCEQNKKTLSILRPKPQGIQSKYILSPLI